MTATAHPLYISPFPNIRLSSKFLFQLTNSSPPEPAFFSIDHFLHPNPPFLIFSSSPTTPTTILFRRPNQTLMDGIDDPFPSSSSFPAKKPYLLPRSLTYHHRFHRPFWKNPIVVYTTSLRGIRRTHEDCCAVLAIFHGLHVAVDERDVSMDAEYRDELQGMIGRQGKRSWLPQVFLRGRHIGGLEEVRQLHEAGEMGRLLEGVPRQDPAFVCGGCGGARFLPCRNCSGSRKVFVEEEGRMRRCDGCNENGLVRCPHCCSSFI